MATVTPFQAFTYNPEQFKDVTPVITPPYDAIPQGDETKYRTRSPYNFAHLDLPKKPDDDYKESRKILDDWFQKGIFQQTKSPAYFLYEQSFSAFGQTHSRRTLFAAVLLHEFSERVVLPHENTHGKYKADRLRLMEATEVNLSQIFGMVKDEEGFLAELYEKWVYTPVFLKGKSDDGTMHSMWKIEGDKAREVSEFFKDQPIYIVDGHHRYESAVQYAKSKGVLGKKDHPAAYTLFAIANAFDPGLVVFPTHRLVKPGCLSAISMSDIEKTFLISPLKDSALKAFVETPSKDPQFGLFYKGELMVCRPKDLSQATTAVSKLSVTWSDEALLNRLGGIKADERATKLFYERDLSAAWEKRTAYELVVFQPKPLVTDVTDVADEKGFMPQKSTYFFPKLAAGIVMRKLTP